MISALHGILEKAAMSGLVVNVNGVGYEVIVPLSTFDKLPREGEKVSLFIHTHLREDSLQLFGFASEVEKKIFRLLINEVSGIGPKLAMNVLSSVSPVSLCSAVADGDVKILGKIHGVGKKTAERIVLELRNKMKDEAFAAFFAGAKDGGTDVKVSKIYEDAVLALVQLGFKYESAAKTVHDTVREMKDKEKTSENIIRAALMKLNS
jgi:Holliday junction DNA helicase RuvA